MNWQEISDKVAPAMTVGKNFVQSDRYYTEGDLSYLTTGRTPPFVPGVITSDEVKKNTATSGLDSKKIVILAAAGVGILMLLKRRRK